MKLYYSPPSPYSRKVRVVALELGLAPDLELVNAMDWDTGYGAINPVNRVPSLVLDDGRVVFDSPVICEYLDVSAGSRLLPFEGEERWRVLVLQALGDGLMDAAVPRRHEVTRPIEQQSLERIKLYCRSMDQILDRLESEVDQLSALDVGTISVACALSYLDFRFAADGWDVTRPKLRKWLSGMLCRWSFVATPLG
ncbi:MAG: putative Glutathione S-transferase family protein [Devosia sp.]|nr:putative Glutathione S-transferase family protein [Devosia sp.]